jgi:hypothetical protein
MESWQYFRLKKDVFVPVQPEIHANGSQIGHGE